MSVHNHGPENGPGLACRESLIGECLRSELLDAIDAVLACFNPPGGKVFVDLLCLRDAEPRLRAARRIAAGSLEGRDE